jgi:hypothetical protein
MLCLLLISIFTFLFTLVWQFAQFILLLQAMAFFGVYSLKYIPSYKVSDGFVILVIRTMFMVMVVEDILTGLHVVLLNI